MPIRKVFRSWLSPFGTSKVVLLDGINKSNEKQRLRHKYRQIKHRVLTQLNHNAYHTGLSRNLLHLFNRHLQESLIQGDMTITIGSYIYMPILQIIPPHLHCLPSSHIHIRYAYPHFTPANRHSNSMDFYTHQPGQVYRIGPYGIKIIESTNSEVANVSGCMDFVLVPLVCFSIHRHRIGEGGGYYDRFIKHNRESFQVSCRSQAVRDSGNVSVKRSIFIGIGLQALRIVEQQEVRNKTNSDGGIFNEWDQKLDYVITESNIY